MSDPTPWRGVAVALWVIALSTMAGGAGMILFSNPEQGSTAGGALVRVGAVLAAVALVLPSWRRPSPLGLTVTVGALVLVLARPALLWVAVVAAALFWWSGRRQRSTSDRET